MGAQRCARCFLFFIFLGLRPEPSYGGGGPMFACRAEVPEGARGRHGRVVGNCSESGKQECNHRGIRLCHDYHMK